MPVAEQLVTIDEFAQLAVDGRMRELVCGRVVDMNPPGSIYGIVVIRIASLLDAIVQSRKIGRVLGGDSGVITRTNPDSLRGADVAYLSFARAPRGSLAGKTYFSVAPELIFEVLSPFDRWSDVLEKIAEYLHADVQAVCVANPDDRTVQIFTSDAPARKLEAHEAFELSSVLPGFQCRVDDFFTTCE
ncbi:MAG TPA: Uma2 family endonuclease [Pirellulaceae bacterium]|jgi:Uma2 family endonuclease